MQREREIERERERERGREREREREREGGEGERLTDRQTDRQIDRQKRSVIVRGRKNKGRVIWRGRNKEKDGRLENLERQRDRQRGKEWDCEIEELCPPTKQRACARLAK